VSNDRLGRGLDELLSSEKTGENSSLSQLPIVEIAANPHQPRNQFDPEKLEELTESIRQQGVVEPIVVRPYSDGDHRYMIVAGERRWRAAQQAGLERIPGIVRDLEPEKAYLLSLVENVQRENLSPLEEARAYNRLIEDEDYSQQQVTEATGKSRSAIANRLRLLDLPESVRDALLEGVLTAGHARALLPLNSGEAETILNEILENDLTVRETERIVQEHKEPESSEEKSTNSEADTESRPAHFDQLEAELESNLGAPVTIESENKKSGTIMIHFSSPDEFETLRNQLKPSEKDHEDDL
jgi:ParB family chromosome partitioning protein